MPSYTPFSTWALGHNILHHVTPISRAATMSGTFFQGGVRCITALAANCWSVSIAVDLHTDCTIASRFGGENSFSKQARNRAAYLYDSCSVLGYALAQLGAIIALARATQQSLFLLLFLRPS
jgi:hypothetical protein